MSQRSDTFDREGELQTWIDALAESGVHSFGQQGLALHSSSFHMHNSFLLKLRGRPPIWSSLLKSSIVSIWTTGCVFVAPGTAAGSMVEASWLGEIIMCPSGVQILNVTV